jgi:hypothetical protein
MKSEWAIHSSSISPHHRGTPKLITLVVFGGALLVALLVTRLNGAIEDGQVGINVIDGNIVNGLLTINPNNWAPTN